MVLTYGNEMMLLAKIHIILPAKKKMQTSLRKQCISAKYLFDELIKCCLDRFILSIFSFFKPSNISTLIPN
ncbi:hypothetical protein KUTeg_014767 [Tegillarca granosa]|uniref:Uncharacterized protein n=1 Tax=Tegillarca granosa TaxID=220873 RepID=A0ABQ9ER30_TEGGR|nr:hypothetical protein KUTeg_014767 [Tegillarca granosa]